MAIKTKTRHKILRLIFPDEWTVRQRKWLLRKMYGIEPSDYARMLEEQGGVCAICEQPQSGTNSKFNYFDIDHDHATGKIRGLLCHYCNAALGYARDNIDVLRRMIAYLEKHQDADDPQ